MNVSECKYTYIFVLTSLLLSSLLLVLYYNRFYDKEIFYLDDNIFEISLNSISKGIINTKKVYNKIQTIYLLSYKILLYFYDDKELEIINDNCSDKYIIDDTVKYPYMGKYINIQKTIINNIYFHILNCERKIEDGNLNNVIEIMRVYFVNLFNDLNIKIRKSNI